MLLDLMFVGSFTWESPDLPGHRNWLSHPHGRRSRLFLRDRGGLRFRKPSFHVRVLAESCANGSSELISQAAAAVTTFLFNRVMMELSGEDGVAAVTIMIYSQFLLTALYIGFSMGVSPVLSYHSARRTTDS